MGDAQTLPAFVSAADDLLLDERSLEKLDDPDGVVDEWQKGAPFGMAGSSQRHTHGLTLPAREVFEGVRSGDGA